MKEKERREILTSQMNSAFANFLFRRSVGLLLYFKNNQIKTGSGSLVNIGSNYFIFTAAHNILNRDIKDIKIAYRSPEYSSKFQLINMGLIGGGKDDIIDVGYIEIDKSIIDEIGIEFLTVQNISCEYNVVNKLIFLFGFPSEIIPKEDALKRFFRFKYLSFVTIPLENNKIPININGDVNIVLKYPTNANLGLIKNTPLPLPYGMSGGSIWILNPTTSERIIGTHNGKFIGIQKSFIKKSGMVIGNKISYLLNLIGNDYPELKGFVLNISGF